MKLWNSWLLRYNLPNWGIPSKRCYHFGNSSSGLGYMSWIFQRIQVMIWPSAQKIVGNSFQPIGDLITGNSIHQGFRRKVTVDVIDQIGNIQFPRILWYGYHSKYFTYNKHCVNQGMTINVRLWQLCTKAWKRVNRPCGEDEFIDESMFYRAKPTFVGYEHTKTRIP